MHNCNNYPMGLFIIATLCMVVQSMNQCSVSKVFFWFPCCSLNPSIQYISSQVKQIWYCAGLQEVRWRKCGGIDGSFDGGSRGCRGTNENVFFGIPVCSTCSSWSARHEISGRTAVGNKGRLPQECKERALIDIR